MTRNPHVELRITAHGGHCGFVGPRGEMDDGYWAETQIVSFAAARHADGRRDTDREKEVGELVNW